MKMMKRSVWSLITMVLFIIVLATPSVLADAASHTVTFDPNNGEAETSVTITSGQSLTETEVPFEAITHDAYDFLGWFYGDDLEYEVIFPLTINQDVVLTAKWGVHTPPSPVKKDGYRLIFQDEFNNMDKTLNDSTWVDKYLSSWTREPALAQPTYTLEEGVMSLEIYEETRPWAEEYDGQTVVSGFTTGNRNGLHNWTKNNVVRNPVETEVTHINQYGYYEIRAKTQPGSSRHSAWWLTGFEDRPEHSAEIDIFEVLGNNKHGVPRAFHAWNDPSQPFSGGASTYTDPTADFHHEWHTYGFDWQEGTGSGEHPDRLVFYVDGKEIGAVNTKIDYPMIQLFSLYEKRAGGWTGPWEWMPYPNSFDIDYVRVYKKIPEENQALSASELEITHIHPSTVTVTEGEAELTTYTSFVLGEEGTEYVESNLPNTLSYVDVEWNDGVVTQEFVKWDPITETDLAQLNNGEGLTKRGRLVNLPENTPGLTEALLMVEVTEAPPLPPYSSINLGRQNDQTQLGKLFDGNYESNSGEFIFDSNTLPENEEVSITYDFEQTVQLHTIELSTNYGNDQGIKAFQLAYYDAQTDTWITLEDTYTVPWTPAGNSERGETLVVEVSVPETTQVKMILTDVGLRWVNKMAMRELSFADHDVILDWIALQTLINEADQYTPDGYTEASFASFTDVRNDAKALLVKENVTQTDIDAHVLALQTAMNALETLPVIPPLDKSLLMERLEEAKAISNDEQTYTDPSFRALQEAIRLVETEMDSISTESELSQLLADLEAALNGLTLVSSPEEGDQEGPVVPNEPDTDNQPEEDTNGADEEDHTANNKPATPSEDQASSTDDTTSDDDSTDNTLPNTATNMYLFIMFGLMLISGGVIVFNYTKKKRA